VYQHKVEPFQLADPTKPGRRTIVAFFLCDPSYTVPSTSIVPPQQIGWLQHLLHGTSSTKSPLLDLPTEVKDRIVEILVEDGAIMDRRAAEEVRAALMQERGRFVKVQDEQIFELEYRYDSLLVLLMVVVRAYG